MPFSNDRESIIVFPSWSGVAKPPGAMGMQQHRHHGDMVIFYASEDLGNVFFFFFFMAMIEDIFIGYHAIN